jgi:asparagine synthase (glutamine-hydrolysing)
LYSPPVRDVLAGSVDAHPSPARVRRAYAQDPLNRMLEAEFQGIFPDQVLAFVDRLSMAHSLEVRSAFLDTEVVEYVASLPGSLKIRNGETTVHPQARCRTLFPERDDSPPEGRLPDAGDRVDAW